MDAFSLHDSALSSEPLRQLLQDPRCGGCVAFEGWVRDHNEGRRVLRLEYEAFAPLALREGERILAEARERFGVERAYCAHRVGSLAIGELAVWVGVSSAHRGESFEACRYIIDQVKHRVPIWKKEHYESGDSGWVNCERCQEAAAADSEHFGHAHRHPHTPEHAHALQTESQK
ncbi:MAG: molybdenum cofactor biosynthesis protein MoaE [Steroidobacteraceae bacterium]